MKPPPIVGQRFVKGDLAREVTGVEPIGKHGGYHVEYFDHRTKKTRRCWCATWESWARHAKLVP